MTKAWVVGALVLAISASGCLVAKDGDTQPEADELRVGKFWFQGEVRELRYRQLGDQKIFEGDIILDPRSEIREDPQGGATSSVAQPMVVKGSANLWNTPGNGGQGVVPYSIHSSIKRPERIAAAIAHIQAKTSIRFVEYDKSPSKYTSHVVFVNANTKLASKYQNACFSSIGRQGGSQEIVLDEGVCVSGLIVHEVGHALGLLHEHTRSDRDAHVRWFAESTRADYKDQFDVRKCADGTTLCDKVRYGDYDLDSIMHYASTYFSNGTINASGHSWTLAKRNADGSYSKLVFAGVLSPKDIVGIQKLYGFGGSSTIEPDPTDTTPDPAPTDPTSSDDGVLIAKIPHDDPGPTAPSDGPSAEPQSVSTGSAGGCQIERRGFASFDLGAVPVLAALSLALRARRRRS